MKLKLSMRNLKWAPPAGVFLVCLNCHPVSAQDQQNDNPQPQQSQEAPVSGTDNNDEDFKPSEEISEDLSVSFPVDI